jgi:Flp pilus assembly protein TadG
VSGSRRGQSTRGQTLVEFALVLPLFIAVLSGIIVFGIGVFYQQQLANAAREAARYAAIHSATSQCPSRAWIDPALNRLPDTFELETYDRCDPPDLGWPIMTAHARSKVFGLEPSQVFFSACWSGYWDDHPTEFWDAPAIDPDDGLPNDFQGCTIGGVDPRADAGSLSCPPPATLDWTTSPGDGDDKASNLAFSGATTTNQVTVYACYEWAPPLLSSFTGGTVTMRAVVTEAMQHQQ